MSTDKRTIGVTAQNSPLLERLRTEGLFAHELDAAKFAMAFAIRLDLPPGTAEGASTKWNVGTLDPDGSLRSLIEALFPGTTEPYRLVEHFINVGIHHLMTQEPGVPLDLMDLLAGVNAPRPRSQ